MNLHRRKFLKAGAGSLALLAATGCDRLPRELRFLALQPRKAVPSNPRRASRLIPSHTCSTALPSERVRAIMKG